VVDSSDPALQQFLENVRRQAAEYDLSLGAVKQEAMALLNGGHSAEALTKLRSNATKFLHSPGYAEFLQRVEEQVGEEQETKQQIARVLDEARLYLRQGALREAEEALAECRAKAPQDAGVVALSSQLLEAKAVLERDRQIQPTHTLDVPPYPEPKAAPAGATVMFNPGAAVADLTPPTGTTMGSQPVPPAKSPTAEPPQDPGATVLYEEPVAQRAVVREEIVLAPRPGKKVVEKPPVEVGFKATEPTKGAGRNKRPILWAVAGVCVLLVAIFAAKVITSHSTDSKPITPVREKQPPVPVVKVPYVINATPWGRVEKIVDDNGKDVKLPDNPEDRETPLLLKLPEGKYTVTLSGPDSAQNATLELATPGPYNHVFKEVNAEDIVKKY
jgi:hypothetical protein